MNCQYCTLLGGGVLAGTGMCVLLLCGSTDALWRTGVWGTCARYLQAELLTLRMCS